MFHFHHARFVVLLFITLFVYGLLPAEAQPSTGSIPVFVDTDIGVDDAIAIAWLLKEPSAEVLGFTTVAGNTSVENATANLLTLLDVAGQSVLPVTVGAAAPLEFPATRIGALIHGPDGLWFQQVPHDIAPLPHDAPAALAAAARANPDLTIIALGPLTNVAQAVQQYPADLAGVHLIALGGAQHGGNMTPVTEFNMYADPHAFEVVLSSDMNIELVTLDAFVQVQVNTSTFPRRLAQRGGALGEFLAAVVPPYLELQTPDEDATTTRASIADRIACQRSRGQACRPTPTTASIPDAAAVIYAFKPELGTPTSALIEVLTDDTVVRGQTIIATGTEEKVIMIADDTELSDLADHAFDPDFDLNTALFDILQRRPDNATAVLQVQGEQMSRRLERTLIR